MIMELHQIPIVTSDNKKTTDKNTCQLRERVTVANNKPIADRKRETRKVESRIKQIVSTSMPRSI